MNVLLSIKPKYATAILDGEKEYEFRKAIFRDKNVEKVYIYSSSPVKKIVGMFRVGEIIEDHPRRIWEKCREKAGMNEEEFFNYFGAKETGFAIKIKEVEVFEEFIDPKKSIPDFTPPQSFCYINGRLGGLGDEASF